MREIFEEAAITYYQEAGNLLLIAAPAVVLGPILVLVAGASLPVAVAVVPIFLVLYLVAYAACVRAAGFVLTNLAPDPGRAYLDVALNGRFLLGPVAPAGLLLAAVVDATLVMTHEGAWFMAIPVIVLAFGALILWSARHAYDLPLLVAHDVPAHEVNQIAPQLTRLGESWNLSLVAILAAPLALGALICWGLAALVTAPFGGALFALIVALWLPYPALVLTETSTRLAGELG